MVSGSWLHHNSDMNEALSLQQALTAHLPESNTMVVLAGEVADYLHELTDEERPAVSRAVPKRQREFATGRHLARQAMIRLGLPPQSVPRGTDRNPLWPAPCIGSITHADALAAVAVAAGETLRGVGIDLEETARVTDQLWDKLFTTDERRRYEGSDPRWPGLVFSAKEAVYKAVNPIAGKFIGFHEVEVDVEIRAGRQGGSFAVRYLGEFEPNRVMEAGRGHFLFNHRYVFSMFVIS